MISAAPASVGGVRYFADAEIARLPPLSQLLLIGGVPRLVKIWVNCKMPGLAVDTPRDLTRAMRR